MTDSACPSLISSELVQQQGANPRLKMVDASWHLPTAGRNPREEFMKVALPGAVFFDIEAISAGDSHLPHTLPDAQLFADAVAELGIHAGDHVVVYDTVGVMSAPRAWWMFRAFGYKRVSVLDGGLPAWVRSGGRVLAGVESQAARSGFGIQDLDLTALAHHYVDIDELQSAIKAASMVVLDARSEGRFCGRDPEPRPHLPSGHMPGAFNLPFTRCVDTASGNLRSAQELKSVLSMLGVPADKPLVASCGSGITACVLALALDQLGLPCRVFDGSWVEWASSGLPVSTER
jgi:thiosulfate/3-mercaptopyruvate sulfurtransferase